MSFSRGLLLSGNFKRITLLPYCRLGGTANRRPFWSAATSRAERRARHRFSGSRKSGVARNTACPALQEKTYLCALCGLCEGYPAAAGRALDEQTLVPPESAQVVADIPVCRLVHRQKCPRRLVCNALRLTLNLKSYTENTKAGHGTWDLRWHPTAD